MSCQKLSRQSLHLVLNEGRGMYSLRSMDISKLLYPSTAEALEAESKAKKRSSTRKLGSISCLPRPSIHYQQSTSAALSNPRRSGQRVLPLRRQQEQDPLLGHGANANVYNTEFHSFITMPSTYSPKGPNSMAVRISRTGAHARSDYVLNPEVDCSFFTEHPPGEHTDSLYVMDMGQEDKQGCFEMLAYYPVGRWLWRCLPAPPFFDELEKKKACNNSNIASAVVDGTQICVSSAGTATYCFDTVACEWRKAGDWVLPFHAKGEYVPELGLWLGVSASSPNDLCALDLSITAAMDSCGVSPMVQHVGLDIDQPEGCSLRSRTLVNLGSGRFCIATFYYHTTGDAQVAVFTGVDVVPCGDNSKGNRPSAGSSTSPNASLQIGSSTCYEL